MEDSPDQQASQTPSKNLKFCKSQVNGFGLPFFCVASHLFIKLFICLFLYLFIC